ncbi:hypothetical protein N1027_11755 [Herbiconiux sp. CPCC 205763]|uniref:Uncharacterized protein n=1 Tax=Herbiconiux aconitum TaxID=2970913 RepID=A0ABT2GRF9_9MICO|nr:hypothetical protein [Herbiconiux aconitum]MCS5718809.1 hypothetical protein [Herbiconiux aconitum]
MDLSEQERLEALLREKYGENVVSFVHYPGLQQVAVRFIDGVKRLHDRDGEPIGRDLPARLAAEVS